jgi:gliding motility-associated-like protein
MIATDNCAVATIVNDYNNTDNASDIYPVGTTVVNWTVTDIHGNITTCQTTIVVTDDEIPSMICPANVTITAEPGLCSANVIVTSLVAADNCGVASIVNDYNNTDNASDVYPVGTTIVTWTVIDIHGNINTCETTITVTDDEQPIITCPADITQTADFAFCSAAVTIDAMIATDNCAIATIVNDYNNTDNASDVYPVGTTVVNWTVTDIHGNITTCQTTIVVTDDEQPIITCPADITQTADLGLCSAAVTVDAMIATDNCAVATIVNDYNNTNNASDVYPVGTTVVNWTVTDIHGNITTCQTTIVVTDDEQPIITCPANITQTADAGLCSAAVTVDAMIATDNCAVAASANDYNNTDNASDIYPVGTTVVNWTVTDIHGNITTCQTTIVVTDDEQPIITCPADITQTADAGVCTAAVSVDAMIATDNCAVATIVNDYNNTNNASDVYPVGTTVVNWTVTDIHGNITTCQTSITITDDEFPTITCPEDITVNSDLGNCSALITVPLAVAADNCGIASVTNDYTGTEDASGIYPVGTTLVTWTVIDLGGNETTCQMNITVLDQENPNIICPESIVQTNDLGVCEAFVTVPPIIAADNCGIATITNDYTNTDNASAVYPVGTTVVLWTVTDIHGNVSTCPATVTVTDNEAPVVTCNVDITQTADLGQCGANITIPIPASTDNCAVDTIVNDYTSNNDASGFYPVGTTTVTWTITDIHGNITNCVQTVIVTDDELPLISCVDNIGMNNDLGACGALVAVPLPTVSDNCAIDELVNDYNNSDDASAFYPVGTTLVTWTLTDIHGNSSNCFTSITITDTEVPSITCPADITVENDIDQCGAFVTVPAPTVSDNCAVLSTANSQNGTSDASGFYPVGTTSVTWTVFDIHGNSSTCTMNITVNDTQLPDVVCPDNQTYPNDNNECGAIVNYSLPVVTDNCADATVTLTNGLMPGAYFPLGTTNLAFTIEDASGNQIFCNFDITIIDTELPVLNCPADLTVSNTLDSCGAFVNYVAPLFTDNCSSGAGVLVAGPEPGGYFEVGTTEVTYSATDDAGNSIECSFFVSVIDNQAPESILCPNDIEQEDAIVEYVMPEFIDNCSYTIVQTEGLISGDVFPHGYTTVQYVATDPAGNMDDCTFTVLINTPPVGVDDSLFFAEEWGATTIDVLDNDFDIDGDSIYVSNVTSGHGQVILNGDGTITYLINPMEWCGIDTLTYTVCDEYNACDTAQVFIDVECFVDLVIPEAISPNGDGINDVFEIIGLEDYPDNKIAIFNRYGHKVFEADGYENNWGGFSDSPLTLGNSLLPKGTYFYVLDLGNDEKPIKGYIYLNR